MCECVCQCQCLVYWTPLLEPSITQAGHRDTHSRAGPACLLIQRHTQKVQPKLHIHKPRAHSLSLPLSPSLSLSLPLSLSLSLLSVSPGCSQRHLLLIELFTIKCCFLVTLSITLARPSIWLQRSSYGRQHRESITLYSHRESITLYSHS